MAYFDKCLQKREEILANGEVMRNLGKYFSVFAGDITHELPFLGSGLSNMHYSLGQLESGLWVATRETNQSLAHITKRNQVENYTQCAELRHNEGDRVPFFCVPVQMNKRIVLLLEDLTKSGDFIPQKPENDHGILDGNPLYHDFGEDLSEPIDYRFTSVPLLIDLDNLQ